MKLARWESNQFDELLGSYLNGARANHSRDDIRRRVLEQAIRRDDECAGKGRVLESERLYPTASEALLGVLSPREVVNFGRRDHPRLAVASADPDKVAHTHDNDDSGGFANSVLGEGCVGDSKQIRPVLNVLYRERRIVHCRSDRSDQGTARRGSASDAAGSVREDDDERFASLKHLGRVLGLLPIRGEHANVPEERRRAPRLSANAPRGRLIPIGSGGPSGARHMHSLTAACKLRCPVLHLDDGYLDQ